MKLDRAREIIEEELPRTPAEQRDLCAVLLVIASNIADQTKAIEDQTKAIDYYG
jgi:hypothetical protein